MNILLLEPFFTGSHAVWATELRKRSSHNIKILKLSGHHWKWRMHGGAISLAKQFKESNFEPALILATDMLDLTTFLALTRDNTYKIPVVLYFHENQLTYPRQASDNDIIVGRDNHYSFINYTSALASDCVLFNSEYHRTAFLDELPRFLKVFPDNNELNSIEKIRCKSDALPLGLDLKKFDNNRVENNGNDEPAILWNHRWEYDKNPETFFNALISLHEKNISFKLVVLGENYNSAPAIFSEAKEKLGSRILQYGYVKSFEEYAAWLWKSDILPVTSHQDFFGISVTEAAYCGCMPLLPNRLAYPEHFPPGQFPELFYDEDNEFELKLRAMIEHKLWTSPNKEELRNLVMKYDWDNLIKMYDLKFKEIKESNY